MDIAEYLYCETLFGSAILLSVAGLQVLMIQDDGEFEVGEAGVSKKAIVII